MKISIQAMFFTQSFRWLRLQQTNRVRSITLGSPLTAFATTLCSKIKGISCGSYRISRTTVTIRNDRALC